MKYKCPNCGTIVDNKTNFCPNCAASMEGAILIEEKPEVVKPENRLLLPYNILLVVSCLFAIGFYLLVFFAPNYFYVYVNDVEEVIVQPMSLFVFLIRFFTILFSGRMGFPPIYPLAIIFLWLVSFIKSIIDTVRSIKYLITKTPYGKQDNRLVLFKKDPFNSSIGVLFGCIFLRLINYIPYAGSYTGTLLFSKFNWFALPFSIAFLMLGITLFIVRRILYKIDIKR